MADIESGRSFDWTDLSWTIHDKQVLKTATGSVRAGELLAVMGPSGAGKSTFMDLLTGRKKPTTGTVTLAGVDARKLHAGSIAYVEQDDALLGVLTVEETIRYSARLCNPTSPSSEIDSIVQRTIRLLGLLSVAKQKIGTPISRGVSGGQKRRVTIGCALVGNPKVLILDEPTSGLDSLSSREVIKALKSIAQSSGIPIICSIHQPNWDTFSMFDSVLVLAQGRTAYCAPVEQLSSYMRNTMRVEVPEHANPADRIIETLNADFSGTPRQSGSDNVEKGASADAPLFFAELWEKNRRGVLMSASTTRSGTPVQMQAPSEGVYRAHSWRKSAILTERNFLNYSRNILGYGVRVAMYLGMGVLLATIWVKLGSNADKINDRLSVHFFSVAFLGFMSVAGIPTFLEERHVFLRERNNGLYTPFPYVIANSLVGLPFLALCSILFSVVSYWSIGLHGGASHFFKFFVQLFLAVYVAESQSILVAAIIPIFVAALAIASFFNGFWMCVQGYFIRAVNLPRFWYWWAHWIDYQTFAFNFLVNNDFRGLTFQCTETAAGCSCPYPSSLMPEQCAILGEDVLHSLNIAGISLGLYAGLLIVIALVYRILLWVVLVVKKH